MCINPARYQWDASFSLPFSAELKLIVGIMRRLNHELSLALSRLLSLSLSLSLARSLALLASETNVYIAKSGEK